MILYLSNDDMAANYTKLYIADNNIAMNNAA